MEPTKQSGYDLLVIDDMSSWVNIIIEICEELGYNCDYTTNYSDAVKKIRTLNYKAICMNYNFGSKSNGHRLLKIIEQYPEIPIALMSGYFIGNLSNLQKKYPTVRVTIGKYRDNDKQQEKEELINDLFEIIPELIKMSNINDLKVKNNDVIVEMNEKSQRKKVFISYASEDYEIAKRLYDDLKSKGAVPWLDRENLLVGQDWRANIPHAIRESSYFLLLISKNSVSKRGYVQKEQKIALELRDEFPENDIFIIPARLDSTEPFDEKLKNLHRADLSDYEKGLEQILKTLKSANFGD